MIDADLGYSGSEIVDRVVAYVGNKSDDFRLYTIKSLPLALQRYAKMHDWSFLFRYNLPLAITQGTNEYTLNVSSIGVKMGTDNISTIYCPVSKQTLVKLDITRLRQDSSFYNSDGNPVQAPCNYAEIGDNKIVIGPELFESQTLRIDGKIDTSNLETAVAAYDAVTNPTALDAVYPEIPFKYQEAFIEYVIAMLLSRENDDRAETRMQVAMELIRSDIRDDMRRSGDELNLRMYDYKEITDDEGY